MHKPYNQLLDEAREISEKKDSIWFTEHHFNHEGMESCKSNDGCCKNKKNQNRQACNVITFHNPIRASRRYSFFRSIV